MQKLTLISSLLFVVLSLGYVSVNAATKRCERAKATAERVCSKAVNVSQSARTKALANLNKRCDRAKDRAVRVCNRKPQSATKGAIGLPDFQDDQAAGSRR